MRWKGKQRAGMSVKDRKPGPNRALHALLPEERVRVLQLARREPYADLSHRLLTVVGWQEGFLFVSFSTVYRILRSEQMMGLRGVHRQHNGRSVAPVRKELTGPNQRWCWDISYLRTWERGLFLYLYVLLDEYSRKVIQWLVSWRQTYQEARRLLEAGLLEESILDLPEESRPEVYNDRGQQMKAKSIRRLLKDHQMPQVFIRPRTPNDNPYVEAMFSTVKGAPQYPGQFLDLEEAQRYFGPYFQWYNTEHPHSGIDYVTPEQAHQGLRPQIVQERSRRFEAQRQWRKEVNRAARTAAVTHGRTQGNPCEDRNPGILQVWVDSRSPLLEQSGAPVSDPHLPRFAQTRISFRNRSGNSQSKANGSARACSVIPP